MEDEHLEADYEDRQNGGDDFYLEEEPETEYSDLDEEDI